MICPVAHSDNPNAKPGCMIPLPDRIRFKDIVKHRKQVERESEDYLKELHQNFANHFSKLAGVPESSNDDTKWNAAYRYYFQLQKQNNLKARKMGLKGTPDGFTMKDGKIFVGDREISEDEAQKLFPGVKVPVSPEKQIHERVEKWTPQDPELLKVIRGKNRIER